MPPLLLLCTLISVYSPAEVCGALYLLESKDGVQLECNRSFKSDQRAVWYQTWVKYPYQLELMNNESKCASNKVPVPGSGAFACHSSTGTDLCTSAPGNVNIGAICEYDFFIVTKPHEGNCKELQQDAQSCNTPKDDKRKRGKTQKERVKSSRPDDVRNFSAGDRGKMQDHTNKARESSRSGPEPAQRTHEEEREPTQDSSDELRKPERTNITLYCNFRTEGLPFILYWIRAAEQVQCLYSVAGVDQGLPLFNEHCCVPEEKIRRIYNHSDSHISAKLQKHNIEIRNASSSDSGRYLCIGALWMQGTYQWEIVKNISLQVEKKNGTKGEHEGKDVTPTSRMTNGNGGPLGNDSWKPILIAIGSVTLISGLIVCLILLMRNKSKGKEVTGSSSTRNTDHPGTLENDECSPYAVGMKDKAGSASEPYYTSVKTPPAPEYSLLEAGSPYAAGMKDKAGSAPEPYYASVKTPRAPEYSLLEASTVTAPKSKTETSTVYALAQM